MAVYYPTPSSPCRVDLLTATYSQVWQAINCAHPTWANSTITDAALDVWEQAQQLKTAAAAIPIIGSGVASLINSTKSSTTTLANVAVAGAQAALNTLKQGVATYSAASLSQALDSGRAILDKLLGGADGVINESESIINRLGKIATDGIGGAVQNAGNALGGLVGNVTGAVGNAINTATGAIGAVVNAAKNGISDLIGGAADFLGDVISNTAGAIGGFVQTAGGLLGGVVGTVRDFIGQIVGNVATGIGGLVSKLGDIPGAIFDVAGMIVEAAGGAIGPILETVGTFLTDPIKGIIGGFFHGEEPVALNIVDHVYDTILGNPETPASLRQTVLKAKEPGAPVPGIIAIFVIPMLLAPVIMQVIAPALTLMQQEEYKSIRPTVIGLGDAVRANFRGAISRETLYDQGARAGYSDQLIAAAEVLGEQLPSPIDLMDWRHRSIISDGAAHTRLTNQGWSPEDASAIIDASEVIPPLGDLVRFAVREAFPGQSAFGGARGSGVPSRFVELAKMQGLDPEFARSYWAAHWELPSVTAAFSMFHRRMIDESQLRALLKEQDFAPEWVDHLIAVAYDPLTRVDVRRMRALGVLTPAQVESAYRDLGYSPQNAGRLADFTEADIAASQRVETAAERDLTRADIVGAYADGIINRSAAGVALRELGYDGDEAELILDREDIRVLRAERKETKGAIVDQAVAGIIDLIAAQDKLNAAQYTEDEVKAALREIERKIAAQVKTPTKADLDKFRKLGIIDETEYRAELERMGYAAKWIEAYVAVGAAGEDQNG